MDTNPEFEEKKRSQTAEIIHNLESAHREDLEVITQVLVKITNHFPEEIKQHLDTMLEHLIEPKKETPTSEERSRAFREWVESHRGLNLPPLSDEAISRESIYGERG